MPDKPFLFLKSFSFCYWFLIESDSGPRFWDGEFLVSILIFCRTHLKFLWGNFFFMGGGWGAFLKVILMSLIEFQNVFPMINFDVWDRLEHVQTIFYTVGLWGSIFHYHTCENSASKWADWSVYKHFIRELLIEALQTLKSAQFETESLQVWRWKIDPHNPMMSKMVWTCPNRSQTSKLIIRNTFWNSISDIRITFKKSPQTPP